MKLELGTFTVKDVVLGENTRFKNGVLSVNQQELRSLLTQDPNFDDVEVNIVHPGDHTRIIHVLDVLEPRFKVSGGSVFPGILGSPETVGGGRTHRLSGMAVVGTSEPVIGENTHFREGIIDMSGIGATYSPFAGTINLVLSFKPKPVLLGSSTFRGVEASKFDEYTASLTLAQLKAASYLAEVTGDMKPDKLETCELKPVVDSSLPRVVYAHRLFHHRLYGEHTEPHIATLLHPNEYMDGALVAGSYTDPAAKRETTYFILNSPVVSELYSRHGRDINFLGVVLYNSALTQHGGQVKTSSYAANLAEILGAQGAVLSGGSQSNLGIPLMLLCQKLERKGIKTVIITTERSDDPADSGLAHAVPEATAIVSTGNYYEKVSLPPMQKVIGGSKLLETNEDASGALNIMIHYLLDATDYNGFGKLFVKQY